MDEYSKDQAWVWDRYWQYERTASCFDVEGSNYPAEIEWEWDEFFKTLPKGAAILDLCTGNGAIARFAAKYSKENNKKFKITGIDKADIDPKKYASKSAGEKAITFKGKISAEAMPLEDNSFDAVISQYGFEYTESAKTLREIVRVLKPGGRVKIITHAAEGTPATGAKEEISKIRFLTDQLDIFSKAAVATEAAWQLQQADPLKRIEMQAGIMPKLQEFRDAMGTLADRLKSDPENPVLQSSYGLLRHTFEIRAEVSLDTLLDKITDTGLETRAHLGRLTALVRASLSEKDAQELARTAKIHGFSDVAVIPFYLETGRKLVGWSLIFTALAKSEE